MKKKKGWKYGVGKGLLKGAEGGLLFSYLIFQGLSFLHLLYSLQNCVMHLKKEFFFWHHNFLKKKKKKKKDILKCLKMNLKISFKIR